MPRLQTPRLKLVPFGLELVQAALENRPQLAELLGCMVPDEWPNTDFNEVLPEVYEHRKQHPEHSKWSALILHQADSVLIGDIGFYGPPDEDGSVTIGYGIVPIYRNKGYATEALRAMIGWAFAQGAKQVLADCEAWNTASIRVLQKAGMRQTGQKDGLIFWQVLAPVGR